MLPSRRGLLQADALSRGTGTRLDFFLYMGCLKSTTSSKTRFRVSVPPYKKTSRPPQTLLLATSRDQRSMNRATLGGTCSLCCIHQSVSFQGQRIFEQPALCNKRGRALGKKGDPVVKFWRGL